MGNGQLTWRQRGRLWMRLSIRLILAALTVFLLARFGRQLLSLFAPFVAALAAAALLNGPVRRIQHALGWSRQMVTLILLFHAFLWGGGMLVSTRLAFSGQEKPKWMQICAWVLTAVFAVPTTAALCLVGYVVCMFFI